MRISRFVMVVAAACFAAGSLIEAQGRGHGPAGHAPQIARTTGSPNAGAGNTHGGKSGNAGDHGKNTSGGSHGNAGEARGHSGTHPGNGGDNHGAGRRNGDVGDENRGNAGGHDETDTDQDARGGGRGRSGPDRGHDGSFVADMNPQLRGRLESMLPSGMTLQQAADGFSNQGQFIAALQQSHNHDISFGDLKTQMTGDKPLSLGDAMRKLGVKTDED